MIADPGGFDIGQIHLRSVTTFEWECQEGQGCVCVYSRFHSRD
jgi:hypothetical protein